MPISDNLPAQSLIIQIVKHWKEQPRTFRQKVFGFGALNEEAKSWYLGSVGEIQVAKTAKSLKKSQVLHSITVGSRGRDLDHIVIAPSGVYIINTKHHQFKDVYVQKNILRIGAPRFLTYYIRDSEKSADEIRTHLTQLGKEVSVIPMIVLVGVKSLQIQQEPPHVKVLQIKDMNTYIQNQPQIFTATQQQEVYELLDNEANWKQKQLKLDPNTLSEYTKIVTFVKRAYRRRMIWVASFLGAFSLVFTGGVSIAIFNSVTAFFN